MTSIRDRPYITRPFNGRPTQFRRKDLETAWLVLADYLDRSESVRVLVCDHGWDKASAMEYVVVAAHWDGKD